MIHIYVYINLNWNRGEGRERHAGHVSLNDSVYQYVLLDIN